MIVHSIALDFFRNYVHLDARFSPEVNVIYGENAQGKTNLLEAVAYLSTASSHRARYDRELIQFGVDHAFVKAEVSARGRDFTLEARLGRGVRRQLYSNGVRLPGGGSWTGVSASSGPSTPRPWRSIAASTSIRSAYSGTGRSTPPCWTPWTSSTCAWPRPGPC